MTNKLKTHFQENKKAYLIAASCFTIGLVGGVTAVKSGAININVVGDGNHVIGKARTVNQVTLNFVERSTPSTPIHLLDSNLYFDSISDAARKLGLDRTKISKHIGGHLEHVKGYRFEVL